MLNSLITSKTRLRLLVKFFINVANEGCLRGLANEMQESTNSIRKELNNLSEAGYLIRQEADNKITYKANTQNPFFNLLQQIVHKYVGLDMLLEMILNCVGEVKRVYIVGDYAKSVDSDFLEIVLEGNYFNEDYLQNLAQKITAEIDKEVKFYTTHQHDDSGLMVFENMVE